MVFSAKNHVHCNKVPLSIFFGEGIAYFTKIGLDIFLVRVYLFRNISKRACNNYFEILDFELNVIFVGLMVFSAKNHVHCNKVPLSIFFGEGIAYLTKIGLEIFLGRGYLFCNISRRACQFCINGRGNLFIGINWY